MNAVSIALAVCLNAAADGGLKTVQLESPSLRVEIEPATGNFFLADRRADVRWPSEGSASPGVAESLAGGFDRFEISTDTVRLAKPDGAAVVFALVDSGQSLEIRYENLEPGEIRALGDALVVRGREDGYILVPCREGLLIPASSGVAFKQTFGTSDYEGCHMNMMGFVKRGGALVVTWDDAYVWPEVRSEVTRGATDGQRLATTFTLRRSARKLRLTPLGKGDWNTIAAGYRRMAEQKRLAETLREKIRRDPHAELLVGAANVKLWTCLARRMNDDSTQEESVKVRWTFAEAASIAEHLKREVGIERCLFILGGWSEGGYDCRHPDNLPANPECGGNQGLADAVRRIQSLGYVACLHDNYQDMYRDAKSWDPACIEKRPDGSLIQGGRWLGGRAYMVCAPKQVELAMRPQNLPAIHQLFDPWSYFIDTTYAVGPRECSDPNHPLGRNDDIAWKSKLSDKARELFGLFGSECGREWALPHSDFFEGLTGVSGRYYHNLKPESLGATVIPFWEMVYHDCQICYGKYGYPANQAAEYVAHHVLCARPLNYHSVPDHRYWTEKVEAGQPTGDRACFARTDRGWAEGLHPADAFLKTTQEVLGPLHEVTAHHRLSRFRFLTENKQLREAVYGEGGQATRVVVNFGSIDAAIDSPVGGKAVLPSWGFLVEHPKFVAFYARSWSGREYPQGALFALQAKDDQPLTSSARTRVFHGFGDPTLIWRGERHTVQREEILAFDRR